MLCGLDNYIQSSTHNQDVPASYDLPQTLPPIFVRFPPPHNQSILQGLDDLYWLTC